MKHSLDEGAGDNSGNKHKSKKKRIDGVNKKNNISNPNKSKVKKKTKNVLSPKVSVTKPTIDSNLDKFEKTLEDKVKGKSSSFKSQKSNIQDDDNEMFSDEPSGFVASKKSFKGNFNDNNKKLYKGKNNKFMKKQGPKEEFKTKDKKELRKQQKELRQKRKISKQNERGYMLPEESKKIFEELRCKKCPPEKRAKLANDLFQILRGKFVRCARSHDLSRMAQWLLKVGSEEVKNGVVNELMSEVLLLSKIKYANHIVLAMMHDCGTEVRNQLLGCFLGHISKLMRNRFAVPIIEEYYMKHAKNVEKAYIRQELYSEFFRGAKNQSYTSLAAVLSQNPTLKSAILKSTKVILSKLIEKQSALASNIVTDVLYDYLQNCEEQDKLDIMEALKTNISTLFKTKSGNKIMILLLWESTPKVKKHMVKEIKAHVLEIAKSNGSMFLRSLFDSVDDTVLIKKAILPTILDHAEELVKDVGSRKVILYLVAHRDPAFFHPSELESLKKADQSAFVKKDISLKEQELLEPCTDALLDKIINNPEFWFSEGKIALVTQAILKKGSGEKLSEAFKAICSFVVKCVSEDENYFVIEDPGIHIVFKKLIKGYSEMDRSIQSFPECLVSVLNDQIIEKLITINRGCFLLVSLLEIEQDKVKSCLKKLFKNKNVQRLLKEQNSKGAEVLRKFVFA